MSSAHQLRRASDLERLRTLAAVSGGRLVLLDGSDRPGAPIRLQLRVRTAGGEDYPLRAIDGVRLRIDLPARYPFERPAVLVETPIFHPNVFVNGVVCQGEQWLPSEGLDLLMQRMARLVTFDPAHVNCGSAANGRAANWYMAQRAATPQAFPTDRIDWGGERVVRPCPACGKPLRLPAGRRGQVLCPACKRSVGIHT